jgi:hypothetical protein
VTRKADKLEATGNCHYRDARSASRLLIFKMEYPGDLTGPKEFVLCFDGTGNKFHGDESDSNVLKIFRVSSDVLP